VLDDEGARDEDRSDQVYDERFVSGISRWAKPQDPGSPASNKTSAFTEAASYTTSEWSWAPAAAVRIADMIGTTCGLVPRKCRVGYFLACSK
jgi:hypothetical protein